MLVLETSASFKQKEEQVLTKSHGCLFEPMEPGSRYRDWLNIVHDRRTEAQAGQTLSSGPGYELGPTETKTFCRTSYVFGNLPTRIHSDSSYHRENW